ncbi:MAG: Uma2 family endonuclease [Dehalococcoidia bacterium]
MPVSEQAYRQYVLEHPDEKWELVCGELRRKPEMTWEHNHTYRNLGWRLHEQLDESEFEVVTDSGRVRRSAENYFIPDLYVVPMELIRRLFTEPGMLEAYPEPLPLVVEVWSPSTGNYDVTTKLEEYKRRGDLEIWFIHPYEHTLTAWRRQSDGSYEETLYRSGRVHPAFLPNVAIDLDTLFE